MDKLIEQKFKEWESCVKDIEILQDLKNMQSDENLIVDAFYKELEFGTAGLRGIMGAGTNRMNVYTIMQVTKAIADYLVNVREVQNPKMVVTYDSRINSQKFAHITASILAENGVKCFITNGCKPTPYLSFLVRSLGCDMGVNITSSHNPKEYNGYKVYERFGCQIDEEIASEISIIKNKINPFDLLYKEFDFYVSQGMIEFVDEEYEEKYLNAVLKESLCKKVLQSFACNDDGVNKCGTNVNGIENKINLSDYNVNVENVEKCCKNCGNNNDLKIVYTALNGVGEPFVTRILNKIGINNLIYVKEQKEPNGNFATCPYPNPEKIEALAFALDYANKNDADLIIATDPDSDRLGVMARDGKTGKFEQISGNDVGLILCEYILSSLKEQGRLPKDFVVIRSIVTSPLVDEVVKAYGGKVVECLTGFKNIGGEIRKLEVASKEKQVLFAYEESCGYLKGTYVRDKDGIVASMLMCELARKLKKHGKTVVDKLNEIKSIYGSYLNNTISVKFGGVAGEKRKNEILSELHKNPLTEIAGDKVVKVVDFFNQTEFDIPKADVLKFCLQSGDIVILRPSGTEPLIKCYITVKNAEKSQKMADIINYINSILK